MSFAEIKEKITRTLQTNVNRFKCRASNAPPGNGSNQYGLRTRNTAPAVPTLRPMELPVDGSPVTEKLVREYLRDRAKLLPKR